MGAIKRGVSLYSLQDSFGRGGLGLEGCVALAESTGASGIEILSDQMIRGAASASEETLEAWDAIMERHPMDRVSDDIFINSWLYKGRRLSVPKQVALLEADLRLARRLGFGLVRLVSQTDPAVIRPALPLAERLGVAMAVEVHAGMSFDHPLTAAWVKEMREIDHPLVGLVLDTGIFCRRFPSIVTEYFRSLGVSEDVVTFVEAIFESGSDGPRTFQRVKAEDGTDTYRFPDELDRLVRSDIDRGFAMLASGYENASLDVLDEYVPWIRSIHGKFWQMERGADGVARELSIDYGPIIARLERLGWQGYVCSEYEGQRFIVPGRPVPEEAQLRLHQEMLAGLINEGE